jgi:hypothetical protein
MSETEHRLASRNVGAAAPRSSPSLNVAKPIYEVLQATCTHQRQDLSKVLSKSTSRQAVPVSAIVGEVATAFKRKGIGLDYGAGGFSTLIVILPTSLNVLVSSRNFLNAAGFVPSSDVVR